MRATRLAITLLAFLPSLFIIKADETELTTVKKNLQNSHLETEDSMLGYYLRQSLLNTAFADLTLLNISDSLPLAIV